MCIKSTAPSSLANQQASPDKVKKLISLIDLTNQQASFD